MKRILVILVAFIGFGFGANAQNVVIQTNESGISKTKDDCGYRIAGICTTEDIGGVDVYAGSWENSYRHLKFENYNDFPVTVIFEFVGQGNYKGTGTISLRANETKETQDSYASPGDFKLIVRKLAR